MIDSGVVTSKPDPNTVSAVMIQWGGSNFLTFSICTTRSHEGASDITEHPVEDGANISDHVRPQLDHITVEAFVSNDPVEGPGSFNAVTLDAPQYHPPLLSSILGAVETGATAVQGGLTGAAALAVTAIPGFLGNGVSDTPTAQLWTFDDDFDAVKDTLDQLRLFKTQSKKLTVITPEHTYNNMVLESFTVQKDHGTGTGAQLTMSFKQLLIAQTSTVPSPITNLPRAKSPVNKGSKAPTDTTQQDSSLLFDITH